MDPKILIYVLLISLSEALPTNSDQELEKNVSQNDITSFQWTRYKIATITTAIIVVGAGLAALTALFFPIFAYKICYALGGCQNTLDNYVDHFIGIEGQTRRIKRELRETNNVNILMDILQLALRQYRNDNPKDLVEAGSTITPVTQSSNHQIEKRSSIDYIEPILTMASKAYNEYVDPGLKKNFEKLPFIR